MAKELFMDTGAWVALADQDDKYHERAAREYPDLLKRYRRLVTTNLVVAETYIILRKALSHAAAITFLESIRGSPRIDKVQSTEELEIEAEDILRRYSDQDFSYTDAVGFALMHQRGIDTAFAFDKHFSIAGFSMVPT
ncbi:MAG: PIN domain-containing protein [Chloroflexota bacterium]|nr:PIN domain-containing protein [Chloroflexota bacterium]